MKNTTILLTTQNIENEIKRLSYFHDASLIRIEFIKDRELDEDDGSLIYPFDNLNDIIKCDIEMTLLHNSYNDCKKTQKIKIEFKRVTQFNFMQKEDFDYSDIYEVAFTINSRVNFSFFSTKDKIKTFEIDCEKIMITELS